MCDRLGADRPAGRRADRYTAHQPRQAHRGRGNPRARAIRSGRGNQSPPPRVRCGSMPYWMSQSPTTGECRGRDAGDALNLPRWVPRPSGCRYGRPLGPVSDLGDRYSGSGSVPGGEVPGDVRVAGGPLGPVARYRTGVPLHLDAAIRPVLSTIMGVGGSSCGAVAAIPGNGAAAAGGGDAVVGCALSGGVVLWGDGVADGAGAVQAGGDLCCGGPEPG